MTGTFHSEQDGYIQAGSVPPPPPITSDIPPAAASWIEMATVALFGAANMGDPEDNAKAQKGHGEREAMAGDAATKFPAGDEQQAQGMDQLAQQITADDERGHGSRHRRARRRTAAADADTPAARPDRPTTPAIRHGGPPERRGDLAGGFGRRRIR